MAERAEQGSDAGVLHQVEVGHDFADGPTPGGGAQGPLLGRQRVEEGEQVVPRGLGGVEEFLETWMHGAGI